MPDQDTASPRTLRLTFRTGGTGLELVKTERVDMITPPMPGERPQAGVNGGFWVELRDRRDDVLAHRLLPQAALGTAEVFSPDGGIRREFGPVQDAVFEVLLPDEPAAVAVTLIGEPPASVFRESPAPGAPAVTRELARFALPS